MREKNFDEMNYLIDDFLNYTSKECEWKVHLEIAQLLERIIKPLSEKVTNHLKQAFATSPESIRWKLWLVASRILQR